MSYFKDSARPQTGPYARAFALVIADVSEVPLTEKVRIFQAMQTAGELALPEALYLIDREVSDWVISEPTLFVDYAAIHARYEKTVKALGYASVAAFLEQSKGRELNGPGEHGAMRGIEAEESAAMWGHGMASALKKLGCKRMANLYARHKDEYELLGQLGYKTLTEDEAVIKTDAIRSTRGGR